MPFRSEAQRKFMYSQHPEIAKRWEAITPDVKLPEHVEKKKETLHQYIKKHRKK